MKVRILLRAPKYVSSSVGRADLPHGEGPNAGIKVKPMVRVHPDIHIESKADRFCGCLLSSSSAVTRIRIETDALCQHAPMA